MATVKLTELMKERQLLSFELFPPKTDKGMENLPGTIEHLCEFKPEYISVTYGAGGGNVGTNREVCQMVKKAGTVPVTHFTVIKNTKEGIKDQLETYLSEGVDHILALRGDFPRGENSTGGDFNYATDLVKFIRKEFGDKFEIAVAGSPEGHIACRSLDADISVLKMKQDNGADYIMTQLCWDMEQFARWQDKIRKAGVTMPIDVGIMPILDQAATINMALSRNGCVMDRELSRLISKYWIFPNPFDKAPFDDALEQKKEDFKKAGIIRNINQFRFSFKARKRISVTFVCMNETTFSGNCFFISVCITETGIRISIITFQNGHRIAVISILNVHHTGNSRCIVRSIRFKFTRS